MEPYESTSNFLRTVTHLTTDAVGSGGWIYPIRGILYFVSHPSLYRSISDVLIKCILGSVGVVVGMFVLTYLPQVAILAVVSGPLAFIGCVCTAHMTLGILTPYIDSAVPLVLGESYAIILFGSKIFFLGEAQDRICALFVPFVSDIAYSLCLHSRRCPLATRPRPAGLERSRSRQERTVGRVQARQIHHQATEQVQQRRFDTLPRLAATQCYSCCWHCAVLAV